MLTESKVHHFADKAPDAWGEFINAMHSGAVFECDEEMYDYWLDVLPPVYMGRLVTLPNGQRVRADFGFAEGIERITAFWRSEGRCFGCQTTQLNKG